MFEANKAGAWDVAFLAIEPVRAAEIAFTAPYVIIEGVYMVPVGSDLKSVADVDRAGVRIAVNKGSAYDLFLTRSIKNATIVRAELGVDVFKSDKLEVAAGVKQPLVAYAKTDPNVRRDGRPLHGDQAGDGRAEGARGGGRALPGAVRRGDEGLGLRRRGAQTQQPTRRRGGTSGVRV